jgi:hypothetical protein
MMYRFLSDSGATGENQKNGYGIRFFSPSKVRQDLRNN